MLDILLPPSTGVLPVDAHAFPILADANPMLGTLPDFGSPPPPPR